MATKMLRLILLVFLLLNGNFAAGAIRVEGILSEGQIDQVLNSRNLFGIQDWEKSENPWNPMLQTYSENFLKKRTQIINYEDAVDRAMGASFALAYGVEQLTRAQLGIHEALGKILPSIRLQLSDGFPIGVNEVFKGLFGFLLPQNWLKLRARGLHLDVAKHMVRKAALDDYLNIQLVFLDLHRIVLNVEIISFYLSHLQMLEKATTGLSKAMVLDLQALYGDVGLDISFAVNQIGIHHNNLALAMVVIQDEKEQYSADALRIDLIQNFPDKLPTMAEIKKVYGTKEQYVRKALEKSVELKAIKELERIAAYNVGVTATGAVFGDDSEGATPNLGITIGYDTIPKILISESDRRTASIDVTNELINFLDTNRRAYGNYNNALRSYTEAKNSLHNNRNLFYNRLQAILNGERDDLDEKFVFSLKQLLKAEIAHNEQLHDGLRKELVMQRYMLFSEDRVLSFLPTDLDVEAAIDKIRRGPLYRKMRTLDAFLGKIHKVKDLKRFLAGGMNRTSWLAFGKLSIRDIVAKKIDLLLSPRKRTKKFFRTLNEYLIYEGIELSGFQEKRLNYQMQNSRLKRWWHDKMEKGSNLKDKLKLSVTNL